MWQVLSFTGNFDAAFVEALPQEVTVEDHPESRRRNKRDAIEARAKVRLALHYDRLRKKINEGKCADGKQLSQKQKELLKLYDNGTLEQEANKFTRISGNGRLRRSDGTCVDIGGSTGGYTRTVLYDWAPPDLSEFVILK